MDYSVLENGEVKKLGWAHGRQIMDEGYFTKKIISNNGTIEWDPSDVPALTLSSQIPIDHSEPKLDKTDLDEFELMLNDHVGNRSLKAKILSSFNMYYSELLKKHLNSEHMFDTTNFTYHWKAINFHYITPKRTVQLHNNSTVKGLLAGFFL